MNCMMCGDRINNGKGILKQYCEDCSRIRSNYFAYNYYRRKRNQGVIELQEYISYLYQKKSISQTYYEKLRKKA